MNSSSSIQAHGGAGAIASDTPRHELHLVCDEQRAFQLASTHVGDPRGADILAAAGRPANPDQVVMQVLRAGGMEDIRLDEHVNLALGNKFVLGVSDRFFRFTVDDKQYQWPYHRISVAMVLELAGVDREQSVELTRADAEASLAPSDAGDLSQVGVEKFTTILEDDDVVDLSGPRTERFKIKPAPRTVTVFYGETEFTLPKGVYTTEQLIATFKVEPGYLLDVLVGDKLVELKPGEKTRLKNGMRFMSHPPRGQSS